MPLSEYEKKSAIDKIAKLKKDIIDITERANRDIAMKQKEILNLETKLKRG